MEQKPERPIIILRTLKDTVLFDLEIEKERESIPERQAWLDQFIKDAKQLNP